MAQSHNLGAKRRKEKMSQLLQGNYWGNCFYCSRSVFSIVLLKERFSIIKFDNFHVQWEDEGWIWEGNTATIDHTCSHYNRFRNCIENLRLACYYCNQKRRVTHA